MHAAKKCCRLSAGANALAPKILPTTPSYGWAGGSIYQRAVVVPAIASASTLHGFSCRSVVGPRARVRSGIFLFSRTQERLLNKNDATCAKKAIFMYMVYGLFSIRDLRSREMSRRQPWRRGIYQPLLMCPGARPLALSQLPRPVGDVAGREDESSPFKA